MDTWVAAVYSTDLDAYGHFKPLINKTASNNVALLIVAMITSLWKYLR